MGKRASALTAAALAWLGGWATAQFNPQVDAVLLASDAKASDQFGLSVAVSGDTAVVGSLGDKAYVFRRDGGGWIEEQILTGGLGQLFGRSVDINDDVIVIGDIEHDGSSALLGPGAAYVYRSNGSVWQLEATLTASDGGFGDSFGDSVAVFGDTVLVGARVARAGYVFHYDGSSWTEQAKLTGGAGQFGELVALSEDTAVVSGTSSTSAIVYVRSGTTWAQQAVINPTSPPNVTAVALVGDTLALGSYSEFWVYSRIGATWSEDLHVTESVPNSNLGSSLSLSADASVLAVGARSETASGQSAGTVHVFRSFGGMWQDRALLSGAAPSDGDSFGFGVSVSGDSVLAGAPGEDTQTLGATGSAYVFDLNPTWVDVGGQLAGTAGLPSLTGDGGLVGGSVAALLLQDAKPFASAPLVMGLTALNASFKGGLLVPNPDILLAFSTDGFGNVSLSGPWPVGVPSGLAFYSQFWISDPAGPSGFAASNALSGTTP